MADSGHGYQGQGASGGGFDYSSSNLALDPAMIFLGGQRTRPNWTPQEDLILLQHVAKHGTRNWGSLQAGGLLPIRDQKACCNRFILLKKRCVKDKKSLSQLLQRAKEAVVEDSARKAAENVLATQQSILRAQASGLGLSPNSRTETKIPAFMQRGGISGSQMAYGRFGYGGPDVCSNYTLDSDLGLRRIPVSSSPDPNSHQLPSNFRNLQQLHHQSQLPDGGAVERFQRFRGAQSDLANPSRMQNNQQQLFSQRIPVHTSHMRDGSFGIQSQELQVGTADDEPNNLSSSEFLDCQIQNQQAFESMLRSQNSVPPQLTDAKMQRFLPRGSHLPLSEGYEVSNYVVRKSHDGFAPQRFLPGAASHSSEQLEFRSLTESDDTAKDGSLNSSTDSIILRTHPFLGSDLNLTGPLSNPELGSAWNRTQDPVRQEFDGREFNSTEGLKRTALEGHLEYGSVYRAKGRDGVFRTNSAPSAFLAQLPHQQLSSDEEVAQLWRNQHLESSFRPDVFLNELASRQGGQDNLGQGSEEANELALSLHESSTGGQHGHAEVGRQMTWKSVEDMLLKDDAVPLLIDNRQAVLRGLGSSRVSENEAQQEALTQAGSTLETLMAQIRAGSTKVSPSRALSHNSN